MKSCSIASRPDQVVRTEVGPSTCPPTASLEFCFVTICEYEDVESSPRSVAALVAVEGRPHRSICEGSIADGLHDRSLSYVPHLLALICRPLPVATRTFGHAGCEPPNLITMRFTILLSSHHSTDHLHPSKWFRSTSSNMRVADHRQKIVRARRCRAHCLSARCHACPTSTLVYLRADRHDRYQH